MKDKKRKNLLLIFVLILFFVSIINFIIVIFSIFSNNNSLIGFASGYINLTFLSSTSINLTSNTISWGFGSIDSNESNATLYTRGNQEGIVLRGNWSGSNITGFVLENIGNVGCNLSIYTENNAHSFFSSLSNTNEEYKINITNKEDNSCQNLTDLGVFMNVNITQPGTQYCINFNNSNNQDELYIDILLTVPFDAGYSGERSDTINILCY